MADEKRSDAIESRFPLLGTENDNIPEEGAEKTGGDPERDTKCESHGGRDEESNAANTQLKANLETRSSNHNGSHTRGAHPSSEWRMLEPKEQPIDSDNLSQSTTDRSGSNRTRNGVYRGPKLSHKRSLSETFNPQKDIKIYVNGTMSDCVGISTASRASSSNLRHRIRLEEVVPSTSSYLDNKETTDRDWKVDLDDFTSKKYEDEQKRKRLPKQVRRYYKMQDELITAYENIRLEVDDAMENAESEARLKHMASVLAKLSFACNLLLLISKAVAAGLSGSLAVISSVIDSAVDLVSGALMWWSNRAMKTRNIYEYPQGRTKLEPIAIVILAVIMSLASVQMIRESVEKIVVYATNFASGPVFEIPSIVICCSTVVIKLCLYLVCRRYKTPSVEALAQDHRNDVLSNSLAVACGLIGYKVWPYADPIGAIVISIYIMGSWFVTGWEQIKMLTGHTARPDFLKKITFIALNHHSEILLIDTVRAFHFGNNFLVEVDVVLPETMTLRESHDIGESLQLKIERLPEVERAFVHLDYETEHSPFSEHKQV